MTLDTDTVASAERPDASTRPERPTFLGFVTDAETEAALRAGLADAGLGALDLRRSSIQAATATLRKTATPRVLVVDVSGEEQPLSALGHLSEAVEPDVSVLVVGEQRDVDFYRQMTRGLGVREYLCKPVTREMVTHHFLPLFSGNTQPLESVTNGRVVTVTSSVGGAGATTIAVNLAWHFAADLKRHTLLLDPDLHMGRAAMMLNTQAGPGLRMALERPDRIDPLFLERAARPAAAKGAPERLHVLSAEEKLEERTVYTQGATPKLIEAVRKRYNLIIADTPIEPIRFYKELLLLAHQRIIVTVPTLASLRDTLRILDLPAGPGQTRRAVVILNRLGMPGGLTRQQVEKTLQMKADVVINDIPRVMIAAANLGQPAAATNGAFRTAISEVARQAAFMRLLDSNAVSEAASKARRGRRFLFGRGA